MEQLLSAITNVPKSRCSSMSSPGSSSSSATKLCKTVVTASVTNGNSALNINSTTILSANVVAGNDGGGGVVVNKLQSLVQQYQPQQIMSQSVTLPIILNNSLITQNGTASLVQSGIGITPSLTNNNNQQSPLVGPVNKIPQDILDDLASRFIINTPVDERNNLIRICFQIELAHWFYLDFYCAMEDKKLLQCGIKQFALHIFQHIPFLRIHLSGIDKILEDWKEYKLSVPTYGAILVSEDLNHVLLVQSYWAKSSWGFPKGKINEHEDPVHCATREVYEETGFDITDLIEPKEYIEAVLNYQYIRLYLIRNVPFNTKFSPRTRKEIKCCEWFAIDSLPTSKLEGGQCKSQFGINANSFFMIMPFMKRLKKWIQDNRSGIEHKFSTSPIPNYNGYISGSGGGGSSSSSISSGFNCNADIVNSTKKSYTDSSIMSASAIKLKLNKKRQRHKSMGDIDGINLINLINNHNNNNSGIIATKINSTFKNECFFEDNNKLNTKRQANGINIQNNIKRQLFNCVSIDSATIVNQRNLLNLNKSIINDMTKKTQLIKNSTQQISIISNNNNSIKKERKNLPNHANNNNQRLRTKSFSQESRSFNGGQGNINNNTNGLQRKYSNEESSGRSFIIQNNNNNNNNSSCNNSNNNNNNTNLSNNNSSNTNTNNTLDSSGNINGFNSKKKKQQQQQKLLQNENKKEIILKENSSVDIKSLQLKQNSNNKFNPNFDSWTNFSFTKNFITNVFC